MCASAHVYCYDWPIKLSNLTLILLKSRQNSKFSCPHSAVQQHKLRVVSTVCLLLYLYTAREMFFETDKRENAHKFSFNQILLSNNRMRIKHYFLKSQ